MTRTRNWGDDDELRRGVSARLQFSWVIAWHILLPAFTVGVASYIALLEGLHLFTGNAVPLKKAG